MNIRRVGVLIIGFVALAVLQLVAVPLLQTAAPVVQLYLVVALLLVMFDRVRLMYVFGLGGAYVLDLYSALPFGVFLASSTLALLVMNVLHQRFLKNRAMHAFVINGTIATAVYASVVLLLTWAAVSFSVVGQGLGVTRSVVIATSSMPVVHGVLIALFAGLFSSRIEVTPDRYE